MNKAQELKKIAKGCNYYSAEKINTKIRNIVEECEDRAKRGLTSYECIIWKQDGNTSDFSKFVSTIKTSFKDNGFKVRESLWTRFTDCNYAQLYIKW